MNSKLFFLIIYLSYDFSFVESSFNPSMSDVWSRNLLESHTQKLNDGVALTRNKRTLIYPTPVAVLQLIMGVGIPVASRTEVAIVGVVIKSLFRLPQNSSFYTNPVTFFARKKRSIDTKIDQTPSTPTRWDLYKIIEAYTEVYGFGGKGCVLKTICELAAIPFDKSAGIFEEILHVLFTPTTTEEVLSSHTDNEYYAAQELGRKGAQHCDNQFNDCKGSLTELFTNLIL